jgi:hypothetical protein
MEHARLASLDLPLGHDGTMTTLYSSHSVTKDGLAWMQTRLDAPGPSLVNL